jgi:hypothetical protein
MPSPVAAPSPADPVPFGNDVFLVNGYLLEGQPERCIEWCRHVIAHDSDDHPYARIYLAQLLAMVGATEEATAAAQGLLAVADASENPLVACMALFAYGFIHTEDDPAAAYQILHRGLKIAQSSGNRQYESHFALGLSRLAATQGDPMDAFGFLAVAIRNHHDSGSFSFLLLPQAFLGAFFDRLGLGEAAATIFGFAASPFALASLPEIDAAIRHTRLALGPDRYEVFARAGNAMSNAEAVAYALDQIDRARAELATAQRKGVESP